MSALPNPWVRGPKFSPSNVAITGGSITGITDLAVADGGTGASSAQVAAQNLSLEYWIGDSAVPVYIAATGSMGNNGALTLGTALGRTHSNGLWLYLPTNAIQAGSTAGFYWTVMFSTTAGTVYNSTYDPAAGVFPGLGTTTAFVSTGPGAFTGATGAISSYTLPIPAGAMGASGTVSSDFLLGATSNANAKTHVFAFGGTTYESISMASNAAFRRLVTVNNTGRTNAQVGNTSAATNVYGLNNAQPTVSSVDTTALVNVTLSLNKATATDNYGVERICLRVRYGA